MGGLNHQKSPPPLVFAIERVSKGIKFNPYDLKIENNVNYTYCYLLYIEGQFWIRYCALRLSLVNVLEVRVLAVNQICGLAF